MKTMIQFFNQYIYLMLSVILTCVSMSCKDDLPGAWDTSDKYTVLKSIKLVNAGADGNKVLIGTIDPDTKMVTFPRVDLETDFTNLRFEAEVSDGAVLEQNVYSLEFGEGQASRSIVFKVVNSPRSGEYLANIVLKLPPAGAGFDQPTVIDYTANALGYAVYPTYTGLATRGAAFDGENVLVVSRSGSTNPHYLKLSDLRNGIINKYNANITGVSGGTLVVQTGALIGGNMIVANISGTLSASPLKFYYYPNYVTGYANAPQVVSFDGSAYNVSSLVRMGDNMTYNLDNNGNGTIFTVNNAANTMLKLVVSNFTTITDAKSFSVDGLSLSFATTCYQVGKTNQFIMTTYGAALRIIDGDGAILYTDNGTVFPANATAARVMEFNGARYLLLLTAPHTGLTNTKLQVYDISTGSNVVEALTKFAEKDALDRKPVYDYSFDYATINGARISQIDWHVVKDEEGKDKTLQIFGSLSDAGFAVIEFPVKTLTDEDE